jgi:hypothetical protein
MPQHLGSRVRRLVGLATLVLVWDRDLQPPILLYVAYVPFEFVVGCWLLVKGSPGRSGGTDRTTLQDGPSARRSAADGISVRPASTA